MNRRFSILLWVSIGLAACNGEIYLRDGVTDGDTFFLAQRALVDDDPVLQSWVTYSLSRSTCQLQIGGTNPARNSSFDCELTARRQLLDTWTGKKRQHHELGDAYLDALHETDDAGFLAEYVVVHHGRSHWQSPADLQLTAYRDWARAAVPGFRPETRLVGSWNYAGKVSAY